MGTPPLGRYTPWQVHPLTGIPQQVHPLDRYTPSQVHPLGGTPPSQVHPQAGTPSRQVHPQAGTPPRQVHPQAGTGTPRHLHPLGRYTPWQVHPPSSVHAGIGSTSGRYASYWNAFLLENIVCYLTNCLCFCQLKCQCSRTSDKF